MLFVRTSKESSLQEGTLKIIHGGVSKPVELIEDLLYADDEDAMQAIQNNLQK